MEIAWKDVKPDDIPENLRQVWIDKGVSIGKTEGEKKLQKTVDEQKNIIKQLNDQSNLTAKEKEELQNRLKELEEANMTSEQKIAKQLEENNKKHSKELEGLTSEKDTFKVLFQQTKITNALTQAAVKHGAFNPQHVVSLLSTEARLDEEKDEKGNGKGSWKVVVPFTLKDAKGNEEHKELDPDEAVKHFLTLPENANLVKANVVSSPNVKGQQDSSGKINLKHVSIEDIQKNLPTYLQMAAEGKIVSE